MKKMMRAFIILALLGGLGGGIWCYTRPVAETDLILYGNVDQRQVALAFIDSERIEAVYVEEGDAVEAGQVLARLETRRLRDRIAVQEAQVKTSQVVLTKLKNGSRPEEIAQAKSAFTAAEAQTNYALQQYERYKNLWETGKTTVSEKDVEDMRTRHLVAREGQIQAQKSLELAEQGPRWEDVAEAEAVLRQQEKSLMEMQNKLLDAELKSPSRSIVTQRYLEPGDMASPQSPVFSLSIVSPKWVRAYVEEPDLGKIRPGMAASVYTDGFPEKAVEGQVGYISPVAEFTPKAVQTPELRTSLVYEVRIYVEDSDDRLRLGMPATVLFPGTAVPAEPSKEP